MMAAFSLLVWAGAIVSGRLLAYTCTHLLRGHQVLDKPSGNSLAGFQRRRWRTL